MRLSVCLLAIVLVASIQSISALNLPSITLGNRTIMFIRHGEKPDSGNDLSPQGYERAKCIAPFFASMGIQHIFACDDHGSQRAAETVQPLSDLIGVPIDDSVGRDDSQGFADAVAALPDSVNTVLVCWEHHAITNLMSAIGVANPPVYPDDHFDLIYTVPYPGATYTQSTEPAECTFPAMA